LEKENCAENATKGRAGWPHHAAQLQILNSPALRKLKLKVSKEIAGVDSVMMRLLVLYATLERDMIACGKTKSEGREMKGLRVDRGIVWPGRAKACLVARNGNVDRRRKLSVQRGYRWMQAALSRDGSMGFAGGNHISADLLPGIKAGLGSFIQLEPSNILTEINIVVAVW
jgi:hypothetical protein